MGELEPGHIHLLFDDLALIFKVIIELRVCVCFGVTSIFSENNTSLSFEPACEILLLRAMASSHGLSAHSHQTFPCLHTHKMGIEDKEDLELDI